MKQTVLELKLSGKSHRQIASMLGLPLGTVRTWCNRSPLTKDNEAHRQCFTIPQPRMSTGTGLALQYAPLPEQQQQTGDRELDAYLWLARVIDTGDAAQIKKALMAADTIKTPVKALMRRYSAYLLATTGNTMQAVFGVMGVDDLKNKAARSLERTATVLEFVACLGSLEAVDTPYGAEKIMLDALGDREVTFNQRGYVVEGLDDVIHSLPEPHTLSDVCRELAYWAWQHKTHSAVQKHLGVEYWESHPIINLREDYLDKRLSELIPKSRTEALSTYDYLLATEYRGDKHIEEKIVRALIGGA
jgi:hypothetical protein